MVNPIRLVTNFACGFQLDTMSEDSNHKAVSATTKERLFAGGSTLVAVLLSGAACHFAGNRIPVVPAPIVLGALGTVADAATRYTKGLKDKTAGTQYGKIVATPVFHGVTLGTLGFAIFSVARVPSKFNLLTLGASAALAGGQVGDSKYKLGNYVGLESAS